ncbi:MAG TPA: TetR/AcrR family transcriptional regulator [Sunxiuqinia sp.]|nr:TetR/AcrR family transcriptional regulator [Sunxiuqinia sp.]
MVQTTFTGDYSEKRDEIIEVAQQKFGLYGLKKTSMIEIARELNMSKGLLYYYFPDKEHLYKAVVEKEISEFESKVYKHLDQLDDPIDKLREYLRFRLDYFRKLLNLSRFRLDEMQNINAFMKDTWKSTREFEKGIIIEILEKGNEKQLFEVKNPEDTADLLFDLLRGIRMSMIKDKQLFYLNEEEYELLVKRSETLIDLLLQGLITRDK